ncbi:MAG TPA: non-canonical purine NTP pyrophosphatase [Acidobacteriota bacterium]|nr:non-canonical purine NTP pyrophosphatase [Acidobacteriota bacterium]
MDPLYFATSNVGKVNTLGLKFGDYPVNLKQYKMDIPEPQENDVKKVASFKILYAFERIKAPCVTLDAGFFIPALGGWPGAFVSQIMGNPSLGPAFIANAVYSFNGGVVPFFKAKHCLTYMDDTLREPMVFYDELQGIVAPKPQGKREPWHWSDLPQIMVIETFGDGTKTLAELTKEEFKSWTDKVGNYGCQSQFVDWYKNRK